MELLTELNGWKTDGVFRKAGSTKRMMLGKQELKDGVVPTGLQVHDVACLIKRFFREQQEGILFLNKAVAQQIHSHRNRGASERALLIVQRAALVLLPQPSLDALRFFFQKFEESNFDETSTRMTKDNLAIVLAPNYFHSQKHAGGNAEEREAQHEFVLKMLEHPDMLKSTPPESVMRAARKIPADLVEKKYSKLVPSRKRSRTAEKIMKLGGNISKGVKGVKRSAEDGGSDTSTGQGTIKRSTSFKRIRRAASIVSLAVSKVGQKMTGASSTSA